MRYRSQYSHPIWITAKYDGKCSQCGGEIKAGDEIVYQRRPKSSVVCNSCGQEWMHDIEVEDRICRHGGFYPGCDF